MATTFACKRPRAFRAALIAAIGSVAACGGQQQAPPANDPPIEQKPSWTQKDIETGLDSVGPALVACYQNAVKVNRNESGSVTISASIAPDGHVESATPVRSSLSQGLASCLADVVHNVRFRAPGVAGVRLSIPLEFEQVGGGAQ